MLSTWMCFVYLHMVHGVITRVSFIWICIPNILALSCFFGLLGVHLVVIDDFSSYYCIEVGYYHVAV